MKTFIVVVLTLAGTVMAAVQTEAALMSARVGAGAPGFVAAVPLPSILEVSPPPLADASAAGKTLLLVGSVPGKPWILENAKRTADALGVRLVLIDKPEQRQASKHLVEDADFIPAPIDHHDPETIEQMASLARARFEGAPRREETVVTAFYNPYAQLAGELVDAIGGRGNSRRAVMAAQDKALTRRLLKDDPELALPSEIVASPEQAAEAFVRIGGPVVMKPTSSGGSANVTVGIRSAEEAAGVFRVTDAGIKRLAARPEGRLFLADRTEILVEKMQTGHEVDVELILRDGVLEFANVADNAPMDRNAIEKNTTYPSQLSAFAQERLIAAAYRAARTLGLNNGNLHIEMFWDPVGKAAKLIEVNPRMGGAFVWDMIRSATGVNLVEQGIRALFGLAVDAGRKPEGYLEARFIIPGRSGSLVVQDGAERAREMPGVQTVSLFKKVGDAVEAPPEHSIGYLGWVAARHADAVSAQRLAIAALDAIRIVVRDAAGVEHEQTGGRTHVPIDLSEERRSDQPR